MALCDAATQAAFHTFMLERPGVWKDTTGLTHWSRFMQLVRNRGGVEAARLLVHQVGLTDGFIRLRGAGRLDLTVEFEMLQTRFECCFTAEERGMARRRLVENGMPRLQLPLEPDCAGVPSNGAAPRRV